MTTLAPSRTVATLAAVFVLLVAACGGNDDQSSTPGSDDTVAPGSTNSDTDTPPAIADDDRDYNGNSAGADTPLEDQSGLPNPDPDNIDGQEGAETIGVAPRDDAGDYANLQWAVDNVAPGGTVELGAGSFFLGDGTTEPKHTVLLRQGLHIVGVHQDGQWHTAVQGGGALGTFSSLGAQLESGPFRVVNETDEHPAVFEDLWIRHWTAEAIYIEASHGFELRNSRLSHPVNTTHGGTLFVHALFSSGEKATGAFTVEDNLVELGDYDGTLPNDEQLLGVFYSNHDVVRVVNNTITTMDEVIEIIGNGGDPSGTAYDVDESSPGEITVEGNSIDATQTVDDDWPGRFTILVANNKGVDSVKIRDNAITMRGKGWAFGLSGENLEVTDNTITFEEHDGAYPPGAVFVGFGSGIGFEMGTSLNNSVFADNVFSGSVTEAGVSFIGGSNDSHDNTFDLGDSIAALGARTTLTITPTMYDNTFTGDLGTVIDGSPEGANEFP